MRRQVFNADSAYISYPHSKSLRPPKFSVSGHSARLPYIRLEEHKQTSGTEVQTYTAPVRTSAIYGLELWQRVIHYMMAIRISNAIFIALQFILRKKIPVKNGPFICNPRLRFAPQEDVEMKGKQSRMAQYQTIVITQNVKALLSKTVALSVLEDGKELHRHGIRNKFHAIQSIAACNIDV